jgi:mannosyltransferase OCH1-like enzyme
MSIPKIIHYCWFGRNPKPRLAEKCINSWKKYCPDYEIIEWNEDNFDVDKNLYCRQAYEAKKWAFVTDYARLWIIYNFGGVYFDTDVEVIKPIDDFMKNSCYLGFENANYVNSGLGFGAEKNHPFVKENMNMYDNIVFLNDDGNYNTTPCPAYTTEILINKGLKQCVSTIQKIEGITIYPVEYFCPKDYLTGRIKKTMNSYSIHHFEASWCTDEQKKELKKSSKLRSVYKCIYAIKRTIKKVIRDDNYNKIKRLKSIIGKE